MMHLVLPRRFVWWLLALLLLMAGGIAAYVRLPAAVITVSAKEVERTLTTDILLSTHASEPDFSKFILPARVLDKTITEQKTTTRTGAKTTDDFARGQIVLINNLDEDQPLLPKTHLKHAASGAYFLTDTPVTIPPGNKVAMAITAKEKGAAGNVPPGRFSIDKLPASIQSDVYGESTAPITGGVIIESPLSEEEIKQARESFQADLQQRLRGQLTIEAGGAALREELMALHVEEEAVSAEAGGKTKEFSITTRARMRAFLVSDTDLVSLTLLALRSRVDPQEEFVSYEPDSWRLTVSRLDFERGEARVAGSMQGTYATKIGPTILRGDNLAGLSAAEVRAEFANIPAVGNVEVTFSPFWVRSVPARPEAVEIVLKEPERK